MRHLRAPLGGQRAQPRPRTRMPGLRPATPRPYPEPGPLRALPGHPPSRPDPGAAPDPQPRHRPAPARRQLEPQGVVAVRDLRPQTGPNTKPLPFAPLPSQVFGGRSPALPTDLACAVPPSFRGVSHGRRFLRAWRISWLGECGRVPSRHPMITSASPIPIAAVRTAGDDPLGCHPGTRGSGPTRQWRVLSRIGAFAGPTIVGLRQTLR